MSDKNVSDFVYYHTGKDGKRTRYAPGTPLPADAVKNIHPDLLRKATAKELKAADASAQEAEPELTPPPPDSGDVDESQK